jgi:hypothetical protein
MKRKIIFSTFLSTMTFFLLITSYQVHADYIWSGTNGYKIYLSPAEHYGQNIGCGGYIEDENAQALALDAAIGSSSDLLARGYSVRVGTGTYVQNTSNSNSWGADYHIPMHSNAATWDCTPPYDLNFSASGTYLMYYPGDTNGSGLSDQLVNTIGSVSPGMGFDRKGAVSNLYELNSTNAPAAYLESAFHTFQPDVDWLLVYGGWSWRVGWAVDSYLGYP